MMNKNWYKRSYRRMLLDFHIPDWNPEFLSGFDAEEFASCVEAGNMTSATVFANTHTGLCNYPTKVGKHHEGWKGRDGLGEMIEALHRHNIDVIVYYCSIYTDWYWDQHPEARIIDVDGHWGKKKVGNRGSARRFSVLCPNNPGYREFVVAQLEEICANYDFEGVWPDMTFWPGVCYCPTCQERYGNEIGGEIPQVVDWENPEWVRFNRKRQAWILEFMKMISDTVKKAKPGATVAHQAQMFVTTTIKCPTPEASQVTDWLSTDLYGSKYTISFFAKLFYSTSRLLPFEHLNSWCYPGCCEHVVTRTEEQMHANAFSSFSNGGAMVFLDAVDPMGAVHRRNYERVGKVFKKLESYEPYVGGEFCQDVAIYYSFDNLYDSAENGRHLSGQTFATMDLQQDAMGNDVHRNLGENLAKTFLQYNVPYGVITHKDLTRLSDFRVIVLPQVIIMSKEEVDAFRKYVEDGGSLYVSKKTSLVDADGNRQADFQLADVFGVSYQKEVPECISYLTPVGNGKPFFADFSEDYPYTIYDNSLLVEAREGAEVLGLFTPSLTDPKEAKRYASIVSDPPAPATDDPLLVFNRYGKGKVIYSASCMEVMEHDSQREAMVALIRFLAGEESFCFETQAPKSVECTLFHQPEDKRYRLNVLNIQQELPNVPVRDLEVWIDLQGKKTRRAVQVPENKELSFSESDGGVCVTIPEIQDYQMVLVEYD